MQNNKIAEMRLFFLPFFGNCVMFKEMERRLKPLRVIIVGRIPEELETDTEIINFETRNQKINKEGVNGNND